jgi:hypothetical protein
MVRPLSIISYLYSTLKTSCVTANYYIILVGGALLE